MNIILSFIIGLFAWGYAISVYGWFWGISLCWIPAFLFGFIIAHIISFIFGIVLIIVASVFSSNADRN